MDRTRDQVMDLGEYTPKSTIPVVEIDVVPSGAISDANQRGARDRRPGGKDVSLRCAGRLRLPVKEHVEVGELELDDGDGGVDLWLPVVEGLVEVCHSRF
jgi:hypothetical protein